MKVVCTVNNLYLFSDKSVFKRLRKYNTMPEGEIDLEIGKEYTVLGLVFWDNSPQYYICVEDDDEYPIPFPAECFNISDDRLSSYWKLSTVPEGDNEVSTSLVFEEWAKDHSFYERLIDENLGASALFNNYRRLMEQEYS